MKRNKMKKWKDGNRTTKGKGKETKLWEIKGRERRKRRKSNEKVTFGVSISRVIFWGKWEG